MNSKDLKKELLFEYLHNNISLKEIDIKDKNVLEGLQQHEIYEVLGIYFSKLSKQFEEYYKEELLEDKSLKCFLDELNEQERDLVEGFYMKEE